MTALVHVSLVPMDAERILPDQTVLIQGGRVAAIGPAQEIAIPEGAAVIDGSGDFLLPGLADMHIHIHENWLSDEWPVSPFHLFLANGVTTVRCLGPRGRSPECALYFRKGIEDRHLIGPRIYTCGKQLRGWLARPEASVLHQKGAGYDFIKLYSYLTKEEFRQALNAAKQVHLYTIGHIPFQVGLDGIVAAGMREIAHVEELFWELVDFDRDRTFDNEHEWMTYVVRSAFRQFEPLLKASNAELERTFSGPISRIARKVKDADIPVCTTLHLDEVIAEKLFEPEAFLAEPTHRYLPGSYIKKFQKGDEKHQRQFKGGEVFAPFKLEGDLMLLRCLKAAGVDLVLGTDAGAGGMGLVPGYSVHDELRVLVQNGFTPYEAIRTATVNAAMVARRMTGKGDFGTIRVGSRADFILTGENPLESIEHLAKPRGVMIAGRWHPAAELDQWLDPGLPLESAVHHVCEPDGRHRTYMDLVIGETFEGALPDDIRSITVTGPSGRMAIQKEDFRYIPGLRDFWISIPGMPEKGMYTFEVVSKDRKGWAADFQYVTRTIPALDPSGFSPAGESVLSTTTPTFRWRAAEGSETLSYRLDLHRLRGGRVYSTGYRREMLFHTLPEGTLEPGHSYRWRIRAVDGSHWTSIQNRRNSEWRVFTLSR